MAIRKVIEQIGDVSNFDVLEAFAREGDWQIKHYANKVRSITCWEWSTGFEEGLRRNVPHARVVIGDSFKLVSTCSDKFDMIVFEGPILCHGGYVEHFEMFPGVFRLLKDHAWLLPEVYTSPNAYRARQGREPVPEFVLKERAAFYDLPVQDEYPVGSMLSRYAGLAAENGFTVLRTFTVPRREGGDMVYCALELAK